MLWTLLIFILCFLPGSDIPDVDVPFIDKWAHIILFGVWSFLWLRTHLKPGPASCIVLLFCTVFIGWEVEYIQGHFIPGRSQDSMDIIADIIGGVAGMVVYFLIPVHQRQYHRLNKV